MQTLIKQAFLHVDVIGPHVNEGHYDLVDSDGQIVLPQIWQFMVKPDWEVVMHMWPMPEPVTERNYALPPPPPLDMHIPMMTAPPPGPPLPQLSTYDDDRQRVKRKTKKSAPTGFLWGNQGGGKKKKGKKVGQMLLGTDSQAPLGNDRKGDEVVEQLLLKWIVTDERRGDADSDV